MNPNPDKVKGLALFPRLLIALLAVVVLLSGLLTTVFYVYNKRAVEKQTMENVLQQFETISYHFRTELRAALIKDLQLLASNPILDAYIMSSALEREVTARDVERFFFESLKYSRNYESITYVNSAGREAVKVNWSGRVRTYVDVSRKPIFTRIKAGLPGGIDVEGPFKDQNGAILFTAGIYKTDADIGQFGGVVMIDHSLMEFFGYLDRIKIFDENPLWVFMPDGTVLKQPADKRALLDPRPFLANDFQKEPALAMVDGGMLVYQDLYVNPDRPLLRLAISIPSSLLLQGMQKLLRFVLIVSALSVIIISVIAYYLAGYLSRPIVELAHAASRLATGDLSTRVKGRSTGEVQLLIDSFNRMSGDLEKTTVSRDYVDNIIRSMMDTLIVVSPDRTITQVNDALSLLLEYDADELVGRPIDVVVEKDPDESMPVVDEVLTRGFIGNSERVYRTRSGKRVPVLFSASLMRDALHDITRIVCVAQDITDRKRNEEKLKVYSEELQKINEELKSFAYIVSHDLRAPLVNIKGFSEELIHGIREIGPILEQYLDGFPEGERRKFSDVLKKDIPEALSFISSSVNRMDSLINAILKLSRAGRRSLNLEPLRVQELVQNIVSSLAHQIESRRIRVAAHALPDVVADKMAMEQIFGNLLDNAIKYLDPGRPGVIEVTAEQSDGDVVFHVRDNGRGMAAEDIPKAFEIFRRVGRQDVPGEGMGLAYVKTLVRLQGGRIWCESEPGKGTTFSFTLPRTEKASGASLIIQGG